MTPAEIRERLESLRAAGAELGKRPAEEILDVLAGLLDAWCAPTSSLRSGLARALPAATGFSPEVCREGLDLALGAWSGERLRELVDRELGDAAAHAVGAETTAVLLAGALPPPSFGALIAPLLLRSPVLVRTAAHDPVTAAHLARSIAAADPALGRCIEIVRFPHDDAACLDAFLEAALSVATGSDETVRSVAARVRAPRRCVQHGHGVSLIALGIETQPDVCARIAYDVAIWDQLGCLSPVGVWVLGGRARAGDVAARLAEELDRIESRLPRGNIPTAAAAASAQQRAHAEMRAAAGRPVRVHAGASYTVVAEDDATLRSAPLHRFVRVHPVADEDELVEALRPLAPWLAGMAVEPASPAMRRTAQRLGPTRICRVGELQAPEFAWPRDRQPILRSLLPDGR